MANSNAVFTVFAFLGFLMCAIPFSWHLHSWNTGTCLYMAWTGIACLIQFINSIVWNDNAIDWSPVWCDISARFIVGTSWAIPAASLCINRRLYHIASSVHNSMAVTKSEKLRSVLIDLAIGLGLPVLGMILQYIPQGHRYNIFEEVGCYPFTYNTSVAYALVWCPPVMIGLFSGVYGILSFIAFSRRRAQYNALFAHSNLTSSRYVRLMCLASVEVLCTVPLGSYGIYLNTKVGIYPWISWGNTHYGFSRVDQIPALIWRLDPVARTSLELSRWLIVVCAFVFFGFFGLSYEARKMYCTAFETIVKPLGFTSNSNNSDSIAFTSSSSPGTRSKSKILPANYRPGLLPVYVHTEYVTGQSLNQSFSDITDGNLHRSGGDIENLNETVPPYSLPPVVPAERGLDWHTPRKEY